MSKSSGPGNALIHVYTQLCTGILQYIDVVQMSVHVCVESVICWHQPVTGRVM